MFESKIIVEPAEQAPQTPPSMQGGFASQGPLPDATQQSTVAPPSVQTPENPQPTGKSFFGAGSAKPKKSGRKLLMVTLLVVLGVILIGAGGAFAAYKLGYVDIPFLHSITSFGNKNAASNTNVSQNTNENQNSNTNTFVPVETSILMQTLDALEKIDSGRSTTAITIAVEEKTADAVVITQADSNGISARDRAQWSELKSNMGQVRTALALYYDDNNAKYPDALDASLSPTYISTKVWESTPMTYTPTADRSGYTLVGKKTLGNKEYAYTVDSQGNNQDDFPAADASSTDAELIEFLSDMLPSDLLISGTIMSHVAAGNNNAPAKALFDLSGRYVSSGTTFEADVTTRIIGDTVYAKINKVPSLPELDFSAITNKWIKIVPEDMEEFSLVPSEFLMQENPESAINSVEARRTIFSLLRAFAEEGVISLGNPTETTQNGIQYTAYDVTTDFSLAYDALIAFVAKEKTYCAKNACLLEEMTGDENLESMDVQEMEDMKKEATEDEDYQNMIKLLQKILRAKVMVAKDNSAYALELSSTIALPDTEGKFENKQVRAQVAVTLDSINSEPTVEAPSPTITFDEVDRIMSGLSEEEWKVKKQLETVSHARSAIDGYRSAHGNYPPTLDDIVQKIDTKDVSLRDKNITVAQVNINVSPVSPDDPVVTYPSVGLYYSSVKEIPKDIYTSQPMNYSSSSNNYTLEYTLALPDNLDKLKEEVYNVSSVVDGKNTADRYVLSREKIAGEDTDGDGLIGSEEAKHNTNPSSRDTDYDGKSDKEEIDAGTDPLVRDTQTTVKPSMYPTSSRATGGGYINISNITFSGTQKVYFGSVRAYVLPSASTNISAIIPGYGQTINPNETKTVSVKIVGSDGKETVVGNFSYTSGVFQDADVDGLSDAEETAIGTRADATDTDGDSYSDSTEVRSGYNPLQKP